MSALLNHNPRRAVSWKGRTINQITSIVQKNTPSNTNIFLAPPLKIYRRELAVNTSSSVANGVCKSRVSASIDELNRPGGSLITAANTNIAGLVGTEFHPTPSTKQKSYGCSSDSASANCAATNARRRCRSSGMVRKTYDPARGDSAYFTNTSQYLVSRSKTFSQNQYRHVRHADVSVINNPMSVNETYSPNGISHCPKAHIVDGANSFSYYWVDASGVDSTQYSVVIPPGYYDVHELNTIFERAMDINTHYYVHNATHQHTYLAKIIYNTTESRIELQAFSTSLVSDINIYSRPQYVGWTTPETDSIPVFYIPNTGIQSVLGFATGYYPDISANSAANQRSTSYGILSSISASVHPSYSVMTYKPSNTRFATQGAVSSSDLVVRRKYETISRNGLGFANVYGSQVGSAMAYGVSDEPYTIKTKIGFPNTKTPLFPKWSDKMQCAINGRVVGTCSSV